MRSPNKSEEVKKNENTVNVIREGLEVSAEVRGAKEFQKLRQVRPMERLALEEPCLVRAVGRRRLAAIGGRVGWTQVGAPVVLPEDRDQLVHEPQLDSLDSPEYRRPRTLGIQLDSSYGTVRYPNESCESK